MTSPYCADGRLAVDEDGNSCRRLFNVLSRLFDVNRVKLQRQPPTFPWKPVVRQNSSQSNRLARVQSVTGPNNATKHKSKAISDRVIFISRSNKRTSTVDQQRNKSWFTAEIPSFLSSPTAGLMCHQLNPQIDQ